MAKITGSIDVKVSRIVEPAKDKAPPKTEDVVETVAGHEFQLEDGGDWERDRDDREWKAGFLFIADRDGYQVRYSENVHGGSTVRGPEISAHVVDPEKVRSAAIAAEQDEGLGLSASPPVDD